MFNACKFYVSDAQRAQYDVIRRINVVRHIDFACKVHFAITPDQNMTAGWIKYFKTCAQAMTVFRTSEYPPLPEDEKAHTVRIAEECLATLDGMEPSTEDFQTWLENFDVDASVFPDDIFRELLEFATDVASTVRRCKRVRRLWENGSISLPQHITAELRGMLDTDSATSDTVSQRQESTSSGSGSSHGSEDRFLEASSSRPMPWVDETSAYHGITLEHG